MVLHILTMALIVSFLAPSSSIQNPKACPAAAGSEASGRCWKAHSALAPEVGVLPDSQA